jgi:hypothetical protein
LALLQSYINDRSTTRAVEVLEMMATRGFTIPPPCFHQLILVGISWRRIIAIRGACTTKDSKMIIDKMVLKYINNIYDQMEEDHYDKQELKLAIYQMKKSQYYYKTLLNRDQSKEKRREKSPKWRKYQKNYILVLIAMNKQALNATQIRKAMFDTFQIVIATTTIKKQLLRGPFTQSPLDPEKWGIKKETYSLTHCLIDAKTQNNVVQRYVEKFAEDLLLKCWKHPIEKIVDKMKQWNSQTTLLE